MNNYALTLRDAGHLEQAINMLRAAIEVEPSDADLRWNLGDILIDQGREGDAVEEYLRATQLAYTTESNWKIIADLLDDLGRSDEALEIHLFIDRQFGSRHG